MEDLAKLEGDDGFELVPLASVRFVRGAGNYSELHLDDGRTRLHDKNLEGLERLLPQRFERIHKSPRPKAVLIGEVGAGLVP